MLPKRKQPICFCRDVAVPETIKADHGIALNKTLTSTNKKLKSTRNRANIQSTELQADEGAITR